MTDQTTADRCSTESCTREARMAISSRWSNRRTGGVAYRDLQTVIHYDDRTAPAKAERFCREHGAALVANLIETVVSPDD